MRLYNFLGDDASSIRDTWINQFQLALGPNLLIISFSSAARIDFSGEHFITLLVHYYCAEIKRSSW